MSTTTTQITSPDGPRTRVGKDRRRALPGWFGAWEITLVVLVAAALIAASVANPFFATGQNFAFTAMGAVGLALMVIPMALLMISGEIDLSIASVFGLAGVVFGMALEAGLALPLAVLAGLLLGAAAGLLNGWLTTAFGLPSLVVTVGTLGLYRGLAFILLENRSISQVPSEFTSFAQSAIPQTYIPFTFVVFIVLAVIAGVILHRGRFGREVFSVGSSAVVSRFSGIPVRRIKVSLFIATSTFASLAGMLYVGYVSSARANNGTGLELTVIAIVLIGGVSMFGGKGSFVGVMLSLILMTVLTSWMNLLFVPTNIQNIVVGAFMIAAVVVPALVAIVRQRNLVRKSRISQQARPKQKEQ